MAGPRWRVYVVMLRSVNVAGRGTVSMKDLRALFEAIPTEDVSTYRQSGNVVCRSAVSEAGVLGQAAEAQLAAQLGLKVAVIVRSAEELADAASGNAFLARGCDEAKVHVTFFAQTPEPQRFPSLANVPAGPDEYEIAGRHAYVHCPDGYGRTKLNNGCFERKLGVAATTRNWRTVTALDGLARSLAAKNDTCDV